MDLLEKLLDNNYNDLIDLTFNNQIISCHKYAILPINEKIYFLLLPTAKVDGMDDNELIILYITRKDFTIKVVDSKDEFKLIFENYQNLINKQKGV